MNPNIILMVLILININSHDIHVIYTGYQRQLNYKHDSGGYSTFGSGEENTW